MTKLLNWASPTVLGLALSCWLGGLVPTPALAEASTSDPSLWDSPCRFRLWLSVDPGNRKRSQSPARIDLDFQQAFASLKEPGLVNPDTVEVFAQPSGLSSSNQLESPDAAPSSPPRNPKSRGRGIWVPSRLEPAFGASLASLHFVIPDETHTRFAVYFDTTSAKRQPSYHGLVGDGDRFRESFQRRLIAPSHFDQFIDFDGDGDLDLFQGGVEPYVYCFENTGGNHLVPRGRLASHGRPFTLPCSASHRSWVTVAFFDIDQDGDQDFFPSFGDGPDRGTIVFYRNDTPKPRPEVPRSAARVQLAFTRVAPLQTLDGTLLAGGPQAGGWFPSVTFVKDFDGPGTGRIDAVVGSNHRGWLYRGANQGTNGAPTFAQAVPLQTAKGPIELVNPRFDCGDLDRDGDLDLVAGCQPGPVYWFHNTGSRSHPVFADAIPVAFTNVYLIGDAHSGVAVADFDRDQRLDIVAGRFWQRAHLPDPEPRPDFGGFFRSTGPRGRPRFEQSTRLAPFTEQFQACDAIRQNSVRAFDWNQDGRLDLLAGDTDGFIWLFLNQGPLHAPLFAPGQRLHADNHPLSVSRSGGHARLAVCDWNQDTRPDLVVADGQGSVTLFLNVGRPGKPALAKGVPLQAGGRELKVGARASVLVCDWNSDHHQDLVLADDKGYYLCLNSATQPAPTLDPPQPVLFNHQPAHYVRPNLGAWADWNKDGKPDFIGCEFENTIRLYRNRGSSQPGDPPAFANPEGDILLRAESPQMISGADVVDWNGDGDLDLLTGQGHGGSGLRFFEHDWIEDTHANSHPRVTLITAERKP